MGLCFFENVIGVIYSGRMTKLSIEKGLAMAKGKDFQTVEVITHVGRASQSELARWAGQAALAAFYGSPFRDVERTAVKDLRRL